MGLIDNLVGRVLSGATITLKEKISPVVYHLRIESTELRTSDYVPGNFLRIHCGMGQVRTYSVWNFDRKVGAIDMAMCVHSVGPGAQFIIRSKKGDTLHYKWNKGKFIVDDRATRYLFIGDLSSLGHLYEIQRNLSPGKEVTGIIYSRDQTDFFSDIDGGTPFDFYTFPDYPVQRLIEIIPEWAKSVSPTDLAYIGGDSRTCAALFHYLKENLQWDVKQIRSKPFWNINKRGLE